MLSQAPAGQALARVEYFIDQDPGLGSGTAIALPANQQSATLAFNAPLTNVTTGAHTLYVRAADKGKAWSLTQQQAFVVKPGGGLATITAFEYYFTGLGTSVSYTSATQRYAVPTPAASVNLSFAADLSQLPGNADYDMHVWAISSEGLRSLVQTKRVRACNNLPVKASFDLAQDARQVYFVNHSTNADRYRWSFGDGTTDTTANPLHTYAAIGNYTVRLISSSFCNPDTITKVVSILGLKDITTNRGGNTGAVSVVVTGAGFVPGMQLLLRRAGQADIVGDTVITRSVGTLTTRFNLTDKSVGLWDVVAIFPRSTTASLPNGFTIETGNAPRLAVSINGSSTLRIGFNQIYTINYENLGNTDANMVPLLITGLPLNTRIEILSKSIKLDSLPSHASLNIPDSLRKYTLNDTAYHMSFRMLFLSKIPANSARTLNVIFHLPTTTPLNTRLLIGVTLGKPLLHYATTGGIAVNRRLSTPIEDFTCLNEIKKVSTEIVLEQLLKLFPTLDLTGIPTCYVGYDALMAYLAGDYVKYNEDVGLGENILDIYEYYLPILPTALSCVQAGLVVTAAAVAVPLYVPEILAVATAFYVAWVAVQEYKLFKIPADVKKSVDILSNCAPLIAEAAAKAVSALSAIVRNASDPNNKYGPGSDSFHHHINPGKPLKYTIGFENLPTANINAQTVRVTDTLSTQAFNLATFAFTSVTIGTSTYTLPAPAKSFVHDFDFVAQYGVKARVIGTFDAVTGLVRWTFFSIDPATNQVTTNALAGFLPPDVVSPKGQGYVSFTVQANAARQTGDVVHNRASIIFDYNAPIITNDWHNTFDLLTPSSAVSMVIPTPVDSVFHVNWTGSDIGSGIQGYSIVYTVNGRRPRTWLADTSATTALFTGRRDSTYCFYSIARDSAGNVEAAPLRPDACKSVLLSQQAATAAVPDGFTVYPNPTPGLFTVEAYALKPQQVSIRIEDVVGHVVYSDNLRLNGGMQRREIDASRFAAGIYFVKISINDKTMVRKLLKN